MPLPTLQQFLSQDLSSYLPPALRASPTSLFGLPRGLERLGGAAALMAGLRHQPTVTLPTFSSFASPEGTAAAGYLRRSFERPSDMFAPGGAFEQQLPLLRRQEEDLRRGYEARLSMAYPSDVALLAQGPVQRSVRRLEEEFLQNRQAMIAKLAQEERERQRQSATSLLGFERIAQTVGYENALQIARQAAEVERQRNAQIAQLGAMALIGREAPQQTVNIGDITATGGAGGAASAMAPPRAIAPSPVQRGQQLMFGDQGSLQGALGLIAGHPTLPYESGVAFTEAVSRALGGQAIGGFEQVGGGAVAVLDQRGEMIGGVLPSGEIISGTTGQVVGRIGAGTTAAGTTRGLGTALGALGTGAGGYFAGREFGGRVGGRTDSQAIGALSGAASGAATGAAIGSVVPGVGTAIGAIIGSLAGAFGGFQATREQQQAIKAEFRTQDVDSQRDQLYEIGNIGSTFLQRHGIDQAGMDAWGARIEQLASQLEGPADEQGLAAEALGGELTRLLGGPPREKAPELRQEFIDYMMTNTFTSGNSIYGGGPPLGSITQQWPGQIGLRRGGRTTRPVHLVGEAGPELVITPSGRATMVGEAGAELLIAAPGTSVIPLVYGRN